MHTTLCFTVCFTENGCFRWMVVWRGCWKGLVHVPPGKGLDSWVTLPCASTQLLAPYSCRARWKTWVGSHLYPASTLRCGRPLWSIS